MGRETSDRHLSAELFAQVLATLKSDDAKDRNRRRAPRVGLRARVMVLPMLTSDECSKPLAAWLRDLSRDGIGLLIDQPLNAGIKVRIVLPRQFGEVIRVEYLIMHCREVTRGRYAIGARMCGILRQQGDTKAA